NACFLGLVGVVVLSQGYWLLWPLRAAWLCYVGRISYGIYLYHYILINLTGQFPGLREVVGFHAYVIVMAVASIAVSMLSWHFIEQPILNFKDRLARRHIVVPSVAS